MDIFDGDALAYANWKKWFLLLHTPEDFPDLYLAFLLCNHLRGEAQSIVDPYFKANWNGENYRRMWEQLDLKYGSEHAQIIVPTNPEQLVKPANKSSRRDYTNTDTLCPVCRDDSHELSTCPDFRKLSTYKRYAVARSSKSCFHCLNRGHPMSSCKVNKGIPCGINGCQRYENPLIHNPTEKDNKTVEATEVVTNFAKRSTNPVGSKIVRPERSCLDLPSKLIAQKTFELNPSQ
jgi:hypothetical protein